MTRQQIADAHLAVAPVKDENVGGVIVSSGKVTFDDLRVSHVFSPVTGRITKILAQPGQRVKRGAPLCQILSPDVGAAFSDVAKAQAALTQSEKDFHRQEELFRMHAAAQKDFEAAQGLFAQNKAELERALKKARLLRSGGNIDEVTQEYTLPSPIEGEVIMRAANPGVEVQGQYSGGQAVELFTIGELDKVWVLADVFEMDLARVHKDARVSVHVVAFPDKTFVGQVEWVSGALDPNTRTAKVRCSIDNALRELKPEMYATVNVYVAEDRTLAIPRPALVRLGESTIVFVQVGTTSDGKLRFQRRPVNVDETDDGEYLPVTHGLEHNESIVTAGAVMLLGLL
jgi:cobalt-zinc-cadmium efflux system membrane fusion protein